MIQCDNWSDHGRLNDLVGNSHRFRSQSDHNNVTVQGQTLANSMVTVSLDRINSRTVVLNCFEELCTSETVEDNRSTMGKRSKGPLVRKLRRIFGANRDRSELDLKHFESQATIRYATTTILFPPRNGHAGTGQHFNTAPQHESKLDRCISGTLQVGFCAVCWR